MKQLTIQELEDRGLILFRALRGSHAHGTNTELSDEDEVVIYINPFETLLGLKVQEQINENKNDLVGYEIGRFCELLLKSNPSMLETLYTPEDCIRFKHPVMDILFDNRDKFITKEIKNALIGYGLEQVRKAQGMNKMQNMEQEQVKRKTPLDFIYTTHNQGSRLFIEELNEKGLKQEYCGLVNVPSMVETYAIFYDYAQHLQREKIGYGTQEYYYIMNELYPRPSSLNEYYDWVEKEENLKYKGIIKNLETSNDISLSSIPKGEKPIGHIQFRKDSYSQHCKKYNQYQTWIKERNTSRWTDNKEHGQPFDSKNIMHVARLLQMGIEIGKGGKELIVRRPDREYLLSIRKGEHDLFQLLQKYEAMIPEIDELFEKVDLPKSVDYDFVNDLLINMRKEFYQVT